jgi:hypothetical protein
MNQLTPEQAAYIAGLLDGEGSLGVYRRPSAWLPYPELSITNTNLEVLEWLKSTVGVGHIRLVTKDQRRATEKWKQAYAWRITASGHIVALLQQIKPYLIIKRAQCQALLAYISYRHDSRFSSGARFHALQLAQTIKRLKHQQSQSKPELANEAKTDANDLTLFGDA